MAPLTLSSTWKVQRTHSDCYTGGRVALSHCNTFLACWCTESITLLDLSTAQVIHTFSDEHDGFLTFALHPSLPELATVQRSGLIRIFSTESYAKLREWKGHKLPVTVMAYDATGNYIVTGSTDRCVKIWNAVKGFATHSASHNDIISAVAFHPDPNALVVFSGARDGSMSALNMRDSSSTDMANHMASVTGIIVDKDSERVISVGRDQVINVWAANTFAHLRTVPAMEELEGVAFIPDQCALPFTRPDSRCFMTIGADGRPKIWSLDEMRLIFSGAVDDDDNRGHMGLTNLIIRDDDFLVTTTDHNLHLKSFDTFAQSKCIIGFNDEILDIALLPSTDQAVIATNSPLIRVLDLSSFSARLLASHTAVVLAIALSPSGRFLASASKDNTLRIWDMSTMQCVAVGEGHTHSVTAVVWGGEQLVYTAGEDRTMKRWTIKDDNSLSVSNTVIAHEKDINMITISPNRKLVASASQDRLVKIWAGDDMSPVATLKGHRRGVWCLAFSPVDKCIATGSGDKTIKIWSLGDFSCIRTLEGHTGSVLRVSFLSAGMQLMSTGADALVKLWTIHTNECISTFEDAHEEKIWAMALSSTQMVTGGADSTISVWEDVTVEEAEKERQSADEKIQVEQEMMNAMRKNDNVRAAALAIKIGNARRLCEILGRIESETEMNTIIGEWDDEQLEQCVQWVQDWNVVASKSSIAQKVLRAIFDKVDQQRLRSIKGIGNIIESLIAYSRRHQERIERLMRKTFLLDYALQSMTGHLMSGQTNLPEVAPMTVVVDAKTAAKKAWKKTKKAMKAAALKAATTADAMMIDPVVVDTKADTVPLVPSKKRKARKPKKVAAVELSTAAPNGNALTGVTPMSIDAEPIASVVIKKKKGKKSLAAQVTGGTPIAIDLPQDQPMSTDVASGDVESPLVGKKSKKKVSKSIREAASPVVASAADVVAEKVVGDGVVAARPTFRRKRKRGSNAVAEKEDVVEKVIIAPVVVGAKPTAGKKMKSVCGEGEAVMTAKAKMSKKNVAVEAAAAAPAVMTTPTRRSLRNMKQIIEPEVKQASKAMKKRKI